MSHRLAGRVVVVTRAAEQAGGLRVRLEAEGAEVTETATIAVRPPADGGAALAAAAAAFELYEWVVVTSVNGAQRLVVHPHRPKRLAAVGPGTAAALEDRGWHVELVPERAVAEGLLEVFPEPSGTGRVLLAQADRARPVLAEGLRAMGWDVDTVVAYRTVSVPLGVADLNAARAADAITFTSASTVEAWVAAGGRAALPPVVVCIGPVTADAARAAGIEVTAVADPHTLDGLVQATVAALVR